MLFGSSRKLTIEVIYVTFAGGMVPSAKNIDDRAADKAEKQFYSL